MSDSVCLMTCFHLQCTWDLPAVTWMCNVTKGQSGIQAAVFNKLLGGKNASKGKADGKTRRERLCRCHHCGACLRLCCFALSRFVNTPRNGQRQHHQQHIYEGFGGCCILLLYFVHFLPPPQCSVLPSVSHSFPCKAGWFWWRAAGCTKSLQVKNAQSSWHFQERLEGKPELV